MVSSHPYPSQMPGRLGMPACGLGGGKRHPPRPAVVYARVAMTTLLNLSVRQEQLLHIEDYARRQRLCIPYIESRVE